ncbi:MAG: aminoacyl-tRNA hydrolase [Lachnospiraceae bacterium]|nr:aminoacyl-tRNA hydrolase [Lachnospiraceae bacterium]
MKIIAGLGNPGRKYEKTRHNCGFEALDVLADRYRIQVTQEKFRSLCGTGIIDGVKVLLIKPQTFMNLSGEALHDACAWYQADPARDLIVMYDDINLEPGQLRIRAKGSAGGHNGMKSIIKMLGTEEFLRIWIGTGHPPDDYMQVDWVLGHFPLSERLLMTEAYDRASRAARDLLTESADKVMSEYNRYISHD